jgi:hypothetical protein
MGEIDGSEHSLKAAEYALEVSKSFNSQLFAVTVTSIPRVVSSEARRCAMRIKRNG